MNLSLYNSVTIGSIGEWLCYTLCPESSQLSDNIFSQCVSKQVKVKVKVVPGKEKNWSHEKILTGWNQMKSSFN